MPASRRRFLVDTDTASDDAVALLMALRHPDVEVLAITVVAGNVPLEQAVQNALYTVERSGVQAPVHAGCAAPLTEPLHTAEFVHGHDGMGDFGLPLAGREPAPGHAVDVLVRTVMAHGRARSRWSRSGPSRTSRPRWCASLPSPGGSGGS